MHAFTKQLHVCDRHNMEWCVKQTMHRSMLYPFLTGRNHAVISKHHYKSIHVTLGTTSYVIIF